MLHLRSKRKLVKGVRLSALLVLLATCEGVVAQPGPAELRREFEDRLKNTQTQTPAPAGKSATKNQKLVPKNPTECLVLPPVGRHRKDLAHVAPVVSAVGQPDGLHDDTGWHRALRGTGIASKVSMPAA